MVSRRRLAHKKRAVVRSRGSAKSFPEKGHEQFLKESHEMSMLARPLERTRSRSVSSIDALSFPSGEKAADLVSCLSFARCSRICPVDISSSHRQAELVSMLGLGKTEV